MIFEYKVKSSSSDILRPYIQSKLKVNSSNDYYEQEADRIAEKVINMPTNTNIIKNYNNARIHRKPLASEISSIGKTTQRKCSECEIEEENFVQRKESGDYNEFGNQDLQSNLKKTRGKGQPMDTRTNTYMSSRFGVDFSQVRIHNDNKAADMSQAIGAKAFTTGKDIYFNRRQYNPGTLDGKRLLAHELSHTIQQQAINQTGAIHNVSDNNPLLQTYSLKGFPKKKTGKETMSKEQRMKNGIIAAVSNVANCKKIGDFTKFVVIKAIRRLRYDYKPNLGLCGWTFPASWYVEIGEKAFDHKKCCYLSSTIAHEAAHTEFKTESGAQELECDCFGCSC